MNTLVRLTASLVALCVASPASAGTIGGTITASGGGALANMEVRAWSQNSKGWTIAATTTTNASGAYSLTVADGDYKVDARMAPGVGGNYGDRYYDVAPPTAGGYVAADADVITVSGTVGGIDIALQALGGMDGVVRHTGAVLHAGAVVRMERNADPRIHHNDISDGNPHLGEFFFRGMPPASDYQIQLYDPDGNYATRRLPGPYTITANTNGNLGNLDISAAPADPYEGNNTANCSAPIDASPLRMNPPQPYVTSGARIGPRGSDPDWFCIQAVDGDRFYLSASTEYSFGGATRHDPWTDPMLAFWSGAGASKLVEDDDSGTGPLEAFADTGPLTAGCYCTSITTFGDGDYNGTGAGSSGAYQFSITMGNRPPVVSIRKGNTEVPASPAMLTIDEGETLNLNLSYADADGDSVAPSFSHVDNTATAVAGGTLNLGATSGDYSWTVPDDGAAGAPYVIELRGAEPEFELSKTILVSVVAVNDPPTTPTLLAPIGGSVVAEASPTLSWDNATDPDGNPLSYEIELYYDGTGGAPDQRQSVAEISGGPTTFTAAPIPENTRVSWRVRARDGFAGVSPWTGFETFLVDSANDAPETPILTKPGNFETVMIRRPGLSVINVEDPEDDPIEFIFEVATDSDFNDIVWTSAAVPLNDVSATTIASPTQDLDWGGEYYARVMARDSRGAESGWSNVRQFRLKDNVAPETPTWDNGCQISIFDFRAPEGIVVTNVVDVEGEAITFELEFFLLEDDPATAAPVLRASATQDESAATTTIPFDAEALGNGHFRYRVRAFDGTDYSDWIECQLIMDLPGAGAGGCCDTGGHGRGDAWLVIAAAMLLMRRRVY